MIRVTRTLAVFAVAGTLMAAPLATTSTAWAGGDGLVNLQVGNVTNTVTIPVAVNAAVLNCVNVDRTNVLNILTKIDQGNGQKYHCSAKPGKNDVNVWNN
jgi:hypothetical protein